MSDDGRKFDIEALKDPTDYNIVSDNLGDIAQFVVEKYEFENNSTLSEDKRREAVVRIRGDLWSKMEEFNNQRKGLLEKSFGLADQKIGEIVKGNA